jgi:hypothetical protein
MSALDRLTRRSIRGTPQCLRESLARGPDVRLVPREGVAAPLRGAAHPMAPSR